MKYLIFISLFISPFAQAYTGDTSSEAIMTYDHWVALPTGDHTLTNAKKVIASQINFIFGPLEMGDTLGAPKTDEVVTDSSIKIEQEASGRFIARYTYRGTVLLKKGPTKTITIPLPVYPDDIWATAEKNKTTKLNPCTDEDYQDKEDFWYFWSLDRPGCKNIIKLGSDYTFVTAKLEMIPNTVLTYPDYLKLPDQNGKIQVTLFVGKQDPTPYRKPTNRHIRNKDQNAQNFRLISKQLEGMGFQGHEWTNEQIKEIVTERINPYPYVLEYTRKYNGRNAMAKELSVVMVYTTIDDNKNSKGFHYMYEHALENSAVMIYDGHSGLGGNLEIEGMQNSIHRQIDFDKVKERYQIYFFNSCSSYAYYNDVYFKHKVIPGSADTKGSQYLDIMTTGLETAFTGGADVDVEFIRALDKWSENGKATSYQTLARKMEADNLFGVNGDEDNPTSAP